MPKRIRPSSLCRAVVTATIGLAAATSLADDKQQFISLVLTDASAKQSSDGDALFVCKVTIDNGTKNDVVVQSRFNSALDGLELVVTNTNGKVLAQQYYTYHQSPQGRTPRDFILKKGETKATLVFPLSQVGAEGARLKVRLVGLLPTSSYGHLLSTETRELIVKRANTTAQ